MAYIRLGQTDWSTALSGCGAGCNCTPCRNQQSFGEWYVPEEEEPEPAPAESRPNGVTPTPGLSQIPALPRTSRVTTFHPGVAHNHLPTGRWADVRADAQRHCRALASRRSVGTALAVECACASGLTPYLVLQAARRTVMTGLPLAQRHVDHYLTGRGADFIENLEDVIRRDSGVRGLLARAIRRSPRGHIEIQQSDYAVRDFQFAFGAIDRLDFEVDPTAGSVHVWFKDRYEWHPVGFGYRPLPGDVRRDTNCVHAAAVELKTSGAADYWMVGDAVVPSSVVFGATSPGRPINNLTV